MNIAQENAINQMKFASAVKNLCGVDIITLQSKLAQIQIDPNQNNILEIILSDDYYNKVNEVYELVKNIDAKTIDCILRINNNGYLSEEIKICNPDMIIIKIGNQLDEKKMEQISNILTRYNNIITSSIGQTYNILLQSQEMCRNDPNKIIRLKYLISKMALILVDKETLLSACSNVIKCPVCDNTTNIHRMYFIIILILFIILFFMAYKMSINKN